MYFLLSLQVISSFTFQVKRLLAQQNELFIAHELTLILSFSNIPLRNKHFNDGRRIEVDRLTWLQNEYINVIFVSLNTEINLKLPYSTHII